MTSRTFIRSIAAIAAIVAIKTNAARADDDNLRSYLPVGANAVAVIDVEKILGSPMGMREHWAEKFKNAYESGPLVVPPNTRRLMLASMIEPATLIPAWEVSIMELKDAPSMKAIARAEGGFADTVAEKPAVCSPINAYFVRLDSRILGTVAPANRQFVARWIRGGVSHSDQLSPYLQTAMASADANTAYLFAFDLADAACAPRVRGRIESGEIECLAGKSIDVDKTCKTIASVRGLSLRVGVEDEISGSADIEFARPAAVLAAVAKPMLIEILGKCGAAIDDFNDWDCKAEGNHLALTGKLSAEGMRKLFSIVDPPSPLTTTDSTEPASAAGAASGKQPDAGGNQAQTIAASKSYFAGVSKIIENIGKKVRGSTSMTQGAAWVVRDARRIDRFPIVDVDPALLEWGSHVSARLSDIAGGMAVGGLQSRARAQGVQESQSAGTNVTYYGGGVIGEEDANDTNAINRRNAARQRIVAATEEKTRVAQGAVKILQEIESSRSTIRRAMTQKYKVEF